MSVGQMSVGQMSAGQMSVGKMSVGEMFLDKNTRSQFNLKIGYNVLVSTTLIVLLTSSTL